MAAKDPNKKYYFDKVGAPELAKILGQRAKEKAEITVWCRGEEEEQAEQFAVLAYHEEAAKIELEFMGGFLTKLTGSPHGNKDVLIKIPDDKIFYFTGGFLAFDKIEKTYELTIKEDIFCSRQRTNYRLMANHYNKIQFKMNDVVYEGLDISAGGTSVLIPADQKEKFAKDTIFKDCTLRFNRLNFNIPKARIAGAWEQKNNAGEVLPEIKIGIAFEQLTEGTEEALFKHINSEARMEEVRKRFG